MTLLDILLPQTPPEPRGVSIIHDMDRGTMDSKAKVTEEEKEMSRRYQRQKYNEKQAAIMKRRRAERRAATAVVKQAVKDGRDVQQALAEWRKNGS